MMGQTSGFEKSVKCTAPIATQFLIAKFGADDDTLSQATAVTDSLVGVFQYMTTVAGEDVRVMLSGITRVKLGGIVTRGAKLTTDANGKAVAAAPAAGVNNNVVGIALASGVLDDVIPMLLAPSIAQG